jgi:hypothetical protein
MQRNGELGVLQARAPQASWLPSLFSLTVAGLRAPGLCRGGLALSPQLCTWLCLVCPVSYQGSPVRQGSSQLLFADGEDEA